MVPTPAAEKITPSVRRLLNELRKEIFKVDEFIPEKTNHLFHLKTTDFIEALLLPRLMADLATKAPMSRIKTTQTGFSLPKRSLETGECDLAIAGFFTDLPDGFYQQKLFQDSFSCCVRKDHPRLAQKRRITLDDFLGERHTLIAPGGELISKLDKLLGKKSERFIEAGLSSFMTSGWIVSQTDTLLTAPDRLIKLLSQAFDVKIFDVPVSVPKISVCQVWHERNHEDNAHKWFRGLVRINLQD